LLRRQRLVSDAQRNVRLYSTIKDRKSPLKGSRPSVPHGTNFHTCYPPTTQNAGADIGRPMCIWVCGWEY